MMPLYEKLAMDRRVLACACALAAGVNFLPWTGPVLRASAALHIPVAALFRPLMGTQAIGLVYVFATAWFLGRREERRLNWQKPTGRGAERPRRISARQAEKPAPRFPLQVRALLFVLGLHLH
jgi:CitMHS family citrate-Mg2+:H+ or citrate-Ca2+:H+ symporter